jgi:hypothetical protein
MNSSSAYQDDLALCDVVLLDSQSTMDIFYNKAMVTSIYTSPESCILQSNPMQERCSSPTRK